MTYQGLHDQHANHHFRVIKGKINIFPDGFSPRMIDDVGDGERVVFVSLGPGETHVTVVDDEGHSVDSWTAVFGWSSLCDIGIGNGENQFYPANPSMIEKALRSALRIYGQNVDTSGFVRSARMHLSGAIGHILDQTVGDAKEYDRIVLAAPVWVHDALADCLGIRPHIDPVIQEL
jgi:hypothetical protein